MMATSEAGDFLKSHKIAHVGTVNEKRWPYIVPLVCIYEGGDLTLIRVPITVILWAISSAIRGSVSR